MSPPTPTPAVFEKLCDYTLIMENNGKRLKKNTLIFVLLLFSVQANLPIYWSAILVN